MTTNTHTGIWSRGPYNTENWRSHICGGYEVIGEVYGGRVSDWSLSFSSSGEYRHIGIYLTLKAAKAAVAADALRKR